MEIRQQAYFIFRKLVYVLYQEIGALLPRNHPQVAKKAYLKTAYFQGERERQAASLYHQIENEENLDTIVAMFHQRTGLFLEDIHQAFAEGDWKNKYGAFNSGGPKWVRIAEVTLELRRLIQEENWEAAELLILDIKGLKTNQGYLVNLFEWTERRR